MPKSLLDELPEIVASGRRQAERILESLENRHRVRLQTREWVLPSRDVSAADWIAQAQRAVRLGDAGSDGCRGEVIRGPRGVRVRGAAVSNPPAYDAQRPGHGQ